MAPKKVSGKAQVRAAATPKKAAGKGVIKGGLKPKVEPAASPRKGGAAGSPRKTGPKLKIEPAASPRKGGAVGSPRKGGTSAASAKKSDSPSKAAGSPCATKPFRASARLGARTAAASAKQDAASSSATTTPPRRRGVAKAAAESVAKQRRPGGRGPAAAEVAAGSLAKTRRRGSGITATASSAGASSSSAAAATPVPNCSATEDVLSTLNERLAGPVAPQLIKLVDEYLVCAEEYFARQGLVMALLEGIDLGLLPDPAGRKGSDGMPYMILPPVVHIDQCSKAGLLKKDHLLFDKTAMGEAHILCRDMCTTFRPSPHVPPEVGKLWKDHMGPLLYRSVQAAHVGLYKAAFGQLFGLIMFSKTQRGEWVTHEETVMHWGDFCTYWQDLSAVWRVLLSRSDDELGLQPYDSHLKQSIGIPGGYRPRIMQMLRDFEEEINGMLACLDQHSQAFDMPEWNGPVMARLNIVDTPLEDK